MSVDLREMIEHCNPGIRKTVKWLNANGFNTIDSGDGVTHECLCDRDYPYVVIKTDPRELISTCDALYTLLNTMGINIGQYGSYHGFEQPEEDNDPEQLETSDVNIQASYDPADQTCIIDVIGLTDELIISKMCVIINTFV